MNTDKIILTGDRPTGPLHLGHYVGSLHNRVLLQKDYKQFVMIADIQAMTDYFHTPELVHKNVLEVMLDYLAVGIDPAKTTFFLQSQIPQIAELALFYLNLVTVNRLRRNPTVKTELAQKGLEKQVTAGFLMYPVHQAADITIVKGTLVPVGADQLPVLEQANEIIRSFNSIYQTTIFEPIEPILSRASRLPGIDGKAKMSKSLNNAIYLSDSADNVVKKVMSMYTDPNHIHVADPGNVEGNCVFTYLDVFDPQKEAVEELKAWYQRGGLGDVVLKKRLASVLNDFLEPIRNKRTELAHNMDHVTSILKEGTEHAQTIAAKTMAQVKEVMKLSYPFMKK